MTAWDYSQHVLIVDQNAAKGPINVATYEAAGVHGLIHKATEGVYYRDSLFPSNIAAAQAAGWFTGAYCFLNGADDPVAQADFFFDYVGSHVNDCALFLDVEALPKTKDPSYALVEAVLSRLRERGVMQVIPIYTGSWYWKGHLGNPNGAALTPYLWDSAYITGTGSPQQLLGNIPPGGNGSGVTPDYFAAYGGWEIGNRILRQFTSSAVIGNKQYDCSVFYGSLQQLQALLIPGAAPQPPIPVTEEEMEYCYLRTDSKGHVYWINLAANTKQYLNNGTLVQQWQFLLALAGFKDNGTISEMPDNFLAQMSNVTAGGLQTP